MRRLLLATAVAAVTAALTAPALAAPPAPPAGVYQDGNGGVCFYVFSSPTHCVNTGIVAPPVRSLEAKRWMRYDSDCVQGVASAGVGAR